ncbi:MAG: Ni/Fe hydrogenase subunit alpha [Desulfobacterales bacterium]|uniref:Ni/Fe hydrogenase subunit alpha n=1 Tax=Candidatus Desulfatibia profunda TaxID=2841695 RepID=A0A8J6NTR6_9BACT|nr:Ni/Fe hydrogenase subunit alpha [Candidatus Desulfatibia profunda]MBL7178764.1 Ni/Fe hydrogenase subunit alpha [Desulfobacterales bacterium]
MGKIINIQPVTRIEGHAKVAIHLDDAGNVADTRLHIQTLRGFEKFVEGRPAEEMPRIVCHICGICPWAHHLASSKAGDACFGVTPPPAAVKLRRLMQMIAYVGDKLLHFYFLAAPDFVIGPDADYSVRNVVGIVGAAPDIAKQVVHLRHLTAQILERFAGRAIHPTFSMPGGVSKPMTQTERAEIQSHTKELLDFSLFTIKFAKENVFPKYMDAIKALGVIKVGHIGTVTADGALDFYDGKLRLMKPDGTYDDFAYDQYLDHIGEHVEPWSYQKFPYAKAWGQGFAMDLNNPGGIYRSNCLARINVCDKMATPRAQAELEEFRANFGRPAHLTLLYHYARLIELVQCAEHMVELLEDPEITSLDVRVKIEPRAGRGVGCVEAPRGTLIHDYETDAEGLITKANLIVGTTHNNAAMNLSVKQAATALIKDGIYDQGILNKVEMAIRAYDP